MNKTPVYPPTLTETIIAEYGQNPFLILISCLLSLRVRDTVTIHVCRELFSHAQTPEALVALPRIDLERYIFKSGSYKNKSETLQRVSQLLIERHNGRVPATRVELLALPGVGPKTAALVLSEAFGQQAICVDTHVQRLSYILGLVNQKLSAEETEAALMKLFPQDQWRKINRLLVLLGQNICKPTVSYCSRCPLASGPQFTCPRIGVTNQK